MKSRFKFALSLIISVLIFTAFIIFSFTGLFDYLESTFYYSRISQINEKHSKEIVVTIDTYLKDNLDYLQLIYENDYLQKNFLPNLSKDNIFNTEKLINTVKQEKSNILFLRLIDFNNKIHYSSIDSDLLEQSANKKVYNFYKPGIDGTNISILKDSINKNGLIRLDGKNRRIEHILPVYDSTDKIRGVAVFYSSEKGLYNFLVSKRLLEIGNNIKITDQAYIVDINAKKTTFTDEIEKNLQSKKSDFFIFPLKIENTDYYLFCAKSQFWGYSGVLVNAKDFELTDVLKYLLIASFGVTLFLIVFLFFNIKPDSDIVIIDRIKALQINFFKEYVDKKDSLDWNSVESNIEKYKQVVNKEIKKGLGKNNSEKYDSLLEKNWSEILEIIGKKRLEGPSTQVDLKNLETIILNALQNNSLKKDENSLIEDAGSAEDAQDIEDVETVEDFEDIEDVQDSEDIEDAQDVEDVETVEDIEDAQDVEDAQDIEDVEDIEDVQDSEDIEDFEDIEDAQDVEDVEDVEPVEDFNIAEDVQDVEDIEDVQDVEDFEDIEDVQDVEDFEDIEDVQDVEDFEDIEDVQDVEDFEDIEDVEPVEDFNIAEDAQGIEDFEDIEDVQDVEDFEDIEDVQDVEDIEDVEPVEDFNIAEDAQGIEDIEDVQDVEDFDIIEDVQDVEDIEDVENGEGSEHSEPVEDAIPVEDFNIAEDIEFIKDIEVETFVEPESFKYAMQAENAIISDEVDDTEDFEPVEDAILTEEVEPVEDIEDAQDVQGREDIEDFENIEDVEDSEPVEDFNIAEDIEFIKDIEVETFVEPESFKYAMQAEDAITSNEFDDTEDFEPVEDASLTEDVESIEDVIPVEDFNIAEDAQGVEDIENAQDIEDVENGEGSEHFEPVEAAISVEDTEDVGDTGPIEDFEGIEDASLTEDVESIEDVEMWKVVDLTKQADEVNESIQKINIDQADQFEGFDLSDTTEFIKDIDVEEFDDINSKNNDDLIERSLPQKEAESIRDNMLNNIDTSNDSDSLKENEIDLKEENDFEISEDLQKLDLQDKDFNNKDEEIFVDEFDSSFSLSLEDEVKKNKKNEDLENLKNTKTSNFVANEIPSQNDDDIEEIAADDGELEELTTDEDLEEVGELDEVELEYTEQEIEVKDSLSYGKFEKRSYYNITTEDDSLAYINDKDSADLLENIEPEKKNSLKKEKDFIKKLEKNKNIELIYLDSISSPLNKKESNIQEDDGVFIISEDSIESSEVKDGKFKKLVDSVISTKNTKKGDQEALSNDSTKLWGISNEPELQEENKLYINKETGFDYDKYLTQFSKNYVGISRSLLRLMQRINANSVGILSNGDNEFKIEYSVGIDGISKKILKFNTSDPFFTQVLNKKAFLIINGNESGIEKIDNLRTESNQGSFLFAPIKLNNKLAYLFAEIGFGEKTLSDYINILSSDLS